MKIKNPRLPQAGLIGVLKSLFNNEYRLKNDDF